MPRIHRNPAPTSLAPALRAGTAALALFGQAACASAPEDYGPLSALTAEFDTARENQVPVLAPLAFEDAQRAYDRARNRLGEADEEELAHLTTLADLRLEVARAEAEAAGAREERARLVAQRENILLGAREEQLALTQDQLQQERERSVQLEAQLGEYEQRRTEAGTVLTLRNINFDLDSAQLSPGDQERLQPLARYLRENPDRNLVIEGHTDAQGSDEYNMDLSQRRAGSVRDFLVAQGVAANRIDTLGRGESVPVADNASQAGRLQNRRIEVTIGNAAGSPTGADAGSG